MKSRTKEPNRKRVIRRSATDTPSDPQLSSVELEELLRVKDLIRLLKVSRTTLWRWVQRGQLSRPLPLSANVIAWRRSAVVDFLRRRENA